MGLFFLKCAPTSWEVASSHFHVAPVTFERHLWKTLVLIDEALPEVIFFFQMDLILILCLKLSWED
jgi:hypothetical protein